MKKLYPIAFDSLPLSSGRHCCDCDLDKVPERDKVTFFKELCKQSSIEQGAKKGLQALALMRDCLKESKGAGVVNITKSVLLRHRTSIDEQLPLLKLMEESGLIQLSRDVDGHYSFIYRVEPVIGPSAIPFITKICTEDMHAMNIPDGTILTAMTMIVFGNHENRVFDECAHFANSKPGGDDLFLTLDFVMADGEYAGKYVPKDILLGKRDVWLGHKSEYPPEYFEIANSAYNVFSYDQSYEAISERDIMTVFVRPPYWCLQEHQVVIELGLSKDGSGKNFLKSIVQPEDPRYLEAMDLGDDVQPGSGVFGYFTPPPQRPDIA